MSGTLAHLNSKVGLDFENRAWTFVPSCHRGEKTLVEGVDDSFWERREGVFEAKPKHDCSLFGGGAWTLAINRGFGARLSMAMFILLPVNIW